MTDLDLQELKRQLTLAPLSIKCPSCGSGPGKDCYGNGPMPYVHAQRTPSTLPISTALALIARIEAAELWSTVHPCNVTHEEPYDFQWCETHDRTFPLDGACDHEGLSVIDYQNKRETEQRVRAIRAEDRIEELEATIQRVRDLHWETLGECAACSLDSSTPYPCPTLKALEGNPND
ncbi:zinc finger domain-containing protein [Timonella senegalensis]|uniref:zinc finger domain-containing protein n=1 Tax=Timonella senegalensis TaxID=1465825 RepID=UPI0028AA4EF8|nr:hypothetical protein [Timonella senegalensis]